MTIKMWNNLQQRKWLKTKKMFENVMKVQWLMVKIFSWINRHRQGKLFFFFFFLVLPSLCVILEPKIYAVVLECDFRCKADLVHPEKRYRTFAFTSRWLMSNKITRKLLLVRKVNSEIFNVIYYTLVNVSEDFGKISFGPEGNEFQV